MAVADIVSSGSVPVKMLYLQKVPNTVSHVAVSHFAVSHVAVSLVVVSLLAVFHFTSFQAVICYKNDNVCMYVCMSCMYACTETVYFY